MKFLISVLLITLAISFASGGALPKGVEIRTFPINSSNNYAAYRLDINNFRNVPLNENYTLFKLLPNSRTLAPKYNVTSVMERAHIGVWNLTQVFNLKLLPWGGAFYECVPMVEASDPDTDSVFDHAGVLTNTTKIDSPNPFDAWRITFTNNGSARLVQRFKMRKLLPSYASTTTKYRVKRAPSGDEIGVINIDQFFYVEVEASKNVSYDLVSVLSDIERTDDYHSYNVTAHLFRSASYSKIGRLSIIFNGNGKRYHTFLSPVNEHLASDEERAQVWHTTLVPMGVDQIESIDFTWFKGEDYSQAASVSFSKIVIEPLYLIDKKVRKDKTIAFLGSSFFLSEMYFNLKRRVDPFKEATP